jgi:peptide-methionine (S)-S-oxide reductase
MPLSHATFGAGCYWGVEHMFRAAFGERLADAEVGFMGGDPARLAGGSAVASRRHGNDDARSRDRAAYDVVCRGGTGFVEVVRLSFDDTDVSYGELLHFFFRIHDPTRRPAKAQYRSVVFAHNDVQMHTASQLVKLLNDGAGNDKADDRSDDEVFRVAFVASLGRRVATPALATTVEPAGEFVRAHEDHQRYLDNHPGAFCGNHKRW